jgi:hypothetical protein
MADEDLQLEQEVTIVSCSCTRHIDSGMLRNGRIVTLCGFSLWPDERPLEPLRDCVFCQKEAADAMRKVSAAEAFKLREGFRLVREPLFD